MKQVKKIRMALVGACGGNSYGWCGTQTNY